MQLMKSKDTKLVSCGTVNSHFPRVVQSTESGLCYNGPYRGLKERGVEHENLFGGFLFYLMLV